MELTADVRREIAELSERYGEPRAIDALIHDGFDDPIRRRDRYGEVLMAVRRPSGNILVAIKTFYPRGAYRLPTGGIHHGERILDAVIRETHEETGLETELRRFLATISYRGRSTPTEPPLFHTFAFLLDEVGGTLGAIDKSERIATAGSVGIGGSWADWGRFRAVAHRVVADALAS